MQLLKRNILVQTCSEYCFSFLPDQPSVTASPSFCLQFALAVPSNQRLPVASLGQKRSYRIDLSRFWFVTTDKQTNIQTESATETIML